MKKAIVALSLLFVSVAMYAQTAATTAPQTQKKAEDYIKFKELTHDFGKIKQGTPVTFDFQFNNISSQPIVIEYASASCGCTTPTWPQAAVAKSKGDKVTAGFNAAAPGPFNKTITVKLAGIELPQTLTITGEVLSAEDFAKYEASKKAKSGSK
jgi:curli biogenesis system outer membrane secretion channel CsgG